LSCGEIFSTIRHLSSTYSRHISDDYFFQCPIIVKYFPYVTVWSKSSSCIINDQCSLTWNWSNFISGIRCVFTSINGISSSCSLLGLFIYKWEKFWRNSRCSIGTISFCKCIFYIQIHIPDWDDVSQFKWSAWILHCTQ